MKGLLPVEEALARIAAGVLQPVEAESVALDQAMGRTLAEPLVAIRTQPPFAASAMDGYALRAEDISPGVPLRIVGESAAGRRFTSPLQRGEAVRIFTGAPIPDGADTILIQENADRQGEVVVPRQTEPKGRFVRRAGLDFTAGDSFLQVGRKLRASDLAFVASLGQAEIRVRRRPRIAVLATGDELVVPGARPGPDQIVASSHLSVMAVAACSGAETRFLGIAPDDLAALDRAIDVAAAWPADALITLGGASVGDHDLVQKALVRRGMALDFWRIAMRPGKPLMHGGIGEMRVLGLPGNPASAIVCAHVFMRPMIAAFVGQLPPVAFSGRLGESLAANDERQDYLRAKLRHGDDGVAYLSALTAQDSSLTRVLCEADALLIRPPHATVAEAGAPCRYLMLD
ncbi:MAG: molybdopterin molybdotransferase MoeA [Beijerinckiaceae bacterium]